MTSGFRKILIEAKIKCHLGKWGIAQKSRRQWLLQSLPTRREKGEKLWNKDGWNEILVIITFLLLFSCSVRPECSWTNLSAKFSSAETLWPFWTFLFSALDIPSPVLFLGLRCPPLLLTACCAPHLCFRPVVLPYFVFSPVVLPSSALDPLFRATDFHFVPHPTCRVENWHICLPSSK